MRKLVFIILKVLELPLIIGVFLGLCKLGQLIENWLVILGDETPIQLAYYNSAYLFSLLCFIMTFILLLGLLLLVGSLISYWIKSNWEWSETLTWKLFKK